MATNQKYLDPRLPKVTDIVFDFDLTLMGRHVFHTVANSLPDHVLKEIPAELHTSFTRQYPMGELAFLYKFLSYDTMVNASKWCKELQGGEERLVEIEQFLKALKKRGIRMYICTRSYRSFVLKFLDALNWRHFFIEIYGASDFPQTESNELQMKYVYDNKIFTRLGLTYTQLGKTVEWARKAEVVQHIAEEVPNSTVLLVDDTESELLNLPNNSEGYLVQGGSGLSKVDMESIFKLTVA